MDSNKPMTLLLIEDDLSECIKYKDCAAKRNDIRFIGMTGSSIDGINYIKTHMPEGVILDIELHRGKGSGIQFLQDMKELKLGFRPLIIIITNTSSNIVYNHVHDAGADLIFYKKQMDYSADMVINSMVALRRSLHTVGKDGVPDELRSVESPEELRIRITDRLNAELDAIGISARHKGRQYLFEAIYILLTQDENQTDSVINQICSAHKHAYSTITRAMQTAINYAWRISSIDDLQIHYTAKINYNTGIPTPTEFIYYYKEKIKKTI